MRRYECVCLMSACALLIRIKVAYLRKRQPHSQTDTHTQAQNSFAAIDFAVWLAKKTELICVHREYFLERRRCGGLKTSNLRITPVECQYIPLNANWMGFNVKRNSQSYGWKTGKVRQKSSSTKISYLLERITSVRERNRSKREAEQVSEALNLMRL